MKLSTSEIKEIEIICNEMVELIDPETLAYILEEPFDSEEGILSNEAFFESEVLFNSDFDLVGAYALHYLSGKLTLTALETSLRKYCISRGVKPRGPHALRHSPIRYMS